MDDLISRQAAIDAIADLYWMDERLLNFKKEIDATFDKVRMLPSATPARPKGKWIKETLFMPLSDSCKESLMCSECGTHWEYNFDFCPKCGADCRDGQEKSEDKE